MTREFVKKLLSAIAGTIGGIFVTEEAYNRLTGVDMLAPRVDHILGVVGIVIGVLGASPLGRLIWKDPEP